MKNRNKSTEEQIIKAAEEVFIEKGFDGARMQEIADKAGINKALLHYYYRSKEKLFAEIFKKSAEKFFPQAFQIFESDKDLFEKIRLFTYEYISLIQENPILPMFILNELKRNRNNLSEITQSLFSQIKSNVLEKFSQQIKEEVKKGTIRNISAEDLIINLVSLCVFPFVSMPIISFSLFDNDANRVKNFIEKRKTEVAEFVIQAIKTEKN